MAQVNDWPHTHTLTTTLNLFSSSSSFKPNIIFFSPSSSISTSFQSANSIFLSHHSSHQLQLQLTEHSDFELYNNNNSYNSGK